MNKKLTSGLAVLAVFGLAISAVPQASAATKSIKIGLLFPTSGPMALLGTDQSVGAEMVLKWANSKGGIKGVPIEIFKADKESSFIANHSWRESRWFLLTC